MTPFTTEIKILPSYPSVRLLAIQGDVDETSFHEIVTTIEGLLPDPQVTDVFVDLEQITFMNSKGLGHLIVLHGKLQELQKKLVLVGTNDFVSDLISMVGVVQMIPYYPTLEEALEKLS